jgi:hypothetical protein
MAFWFDTNGVRYDFRDGQHADFVFGSESDNSRTSEIPTKDQYECSHNLLVPEWPRS